MDHRCGENAVATAKSLELFLPAEETGWEGLTLGLLSFIHTSWILVGLDYMYTVQPVMITREKYFRLSSAFISKEHKTQIEINVGEVQTLD